MAHLHYFYDAPRESHGYIVTPPKDYQKIVQGTAVIYRFENAGAVDGNGKVLIPFEYDDVKVSYNSKDLTFVQVEKEGVVEAYSLKNGKATESKFASDITAITDLDLNAKKTKSYYATSKVTGKSVYDQDITQFGVVDSLGKTILPFEYEKIGQQTTINNKTYFCVTKDGKTGMVDMGNEVFIPFEYGSIIQCIYLSDTPVLIVYNKKERLSGAISIENEEILATEYNTILENNGIVLRFRDKNKKWGLANHEGIVTAPEYESIGFLESNYIAYQNGALIGLLDPNGNKLSEAIYKKIHCNSALLTYSKSALNEKGLEIEDVVAVLIRPENTYEVYTKAGKIVDLGAY